MRRLIQLLLDRIGAHLPLQFKVLHKQFLLRVVDLEALSIEADIPRFLGQFAGVLIMFSFIHAFAVYVQIMAYPFRLEHYLISTMMLVAGLITVVSWDSTFPDRRDIMVLAPLPIRPAMILSAKICASASLLGVAILALNTAPAFVASLLLGQLHSSIFGFFQVLAAYSITMSAATLFLYCAVLSFQGLTALLLPRRLFLQLSAFLQLFAFGLFISVYFLEPALGTLPELLATQNRQVLALSPQFWFLAMFNEVNGSLPRELFWLAIRAWTALGIVIAGASVSLLLSYLRTMKKTIEAPDLLPGASRTRWMPHLGGLRSAIMVFSFRSLTRSRQHRVVFAFFLAIVTAIGITCMRREIYAPSPEPLPSDFLISTLTMMTISVLGLRVIFSLPISLHANWMIQTTQLQRTSKYMAATRSTLLLFSVLPMTIVSALLSLNYRPWPRVAAHLGLLLSFGLLFAEMAMIKFDKVPFTCSYLPGKANVQVIFWGAVSIWITLAILAGTCEQRALQHLTEYVTMAGVLLALVIGLGIVNRWRARSAILYFEEVQPEVITRLGLLFVPPPQASDPSISGPL
jgi:hypothetical protein